MSRAKELIPQFKAAALRYLPAAVMVGAAVFAKSYANDHAAQSRSIYSTAVKTTDKEKRAVLLKDAGRERSKELYGDLGFVFLLTGAGGYTFVTHCRRTQNATLGNKHVPFSPT